MIAATFEGQRELVQRLDQVARSPSVETTTAGVQKALEELIGSGKIRLSRDLREHAEARYARRLLYRSEDLGYTIIAMIWGPGQGVPLHDHDGTWCVEGVLEGEIVVTPYELLERNDDRWHFEPSDTIHSHVGSAGSLIPPFEYHTIANARTSEPSITLHVYGRELQQCTIFEGGQDGWYERQTRALWYNN